MNDQDNTESKERNEGKLSRIFACYDSDDELSDSNEETRCDDVFEKAKQNDPAEEDDGDSGELLSEFYVSFLEVLKADFGAPKSFGWFS